MSDSILKGYFRVCSKWKYVIIGIVVFTVIVSSVLNFFVFKDVFKGVGVVTPAQIGGVVLQPQSGSLTITTQQILTAQQTLQIINSDSFMQELAKNLRIPMQDLKGNFEAAITQTQNTSQWNLVVEFQSSDVELIRKFFVEFIGLLNNYIKEEYNQQLNSLKDYADQLNSQLKIIDTQTSEISKKMFELLNKDGSVKSEYFLEYSTLRNSYESLLTQEMQLKQQIASINIAISNSNPFSYNGYSILEKPVKPKRLFNVAVSAVVAVFLAILVALFAEYVKELKDNG